MSLFKARDWWAAVLGEGEEFDQGCLCVGDVDNSGSGHDKIVVGSYMGMLRVFSPHPAKPGEPSPAHSQLLEVQLRDPVIQVEVGKFVSCSDLLHLAVLHPRKLSVYSVSGTAGNVEHGVQYQLKRVYEHNLQRTACNMTYGTFGGVTDHHSMCIQSMDGMLMFFEQESYSFGRFLPGFLLPGPLCYCSRTDTFLTVSSARQVESYRYETLAVATDAETRQDAEQHSKTAGKRLTADWTLVLGEQALDLSVPSFSPSSSSIFVCGERNLYCLKDNGHIRFMKKLEYNPSCFLPYASVSEGTTNTLVGNHNNMLLVYQDVTLKWAAQLSCSPVAVRLANFPDLKGVVVTLSNEGHLQCSYMGTDPSFFSTPKVDAREQDYSQIDTEMKSLQRVIRQATRTQADILPVAETDEDLTVTATVSTNMDSTSQALIPDIDGLPVPSVTVKIKVTSRCALQGPKLTVCVQPPLAVTQDQLVLEPLGVGSTTVVAFSAFLNGQYPPADLTGDVAVSYSSPTELNPAGIPRVAQCKFSLPLRLVCCPSAPSKNAKYKITVDTNKPPVNLSEVFPDFLEKSEDKEGNALAFHFLSGPRVTVLASKTSQRYRIQSESFEDIWLVVKELVQRFDRHFAKQGVKDFRNSFAGPIPLAEYFETVDHHFELRVSAEKYQDLLSERAVQFRAIQRRLLTRFKDKTPAPLQNLDTLMEGTYRQGWEESVDAAVSHLLRTCLSRSPKDQALSLSTSQLSMPKDTVRLKKHITLLCDRLGKGGRLSLASEANVPTPVMMPGGCEPIAEAVADLEEPPLQQESAAKFIKKKQPSKKVKSKTDKESKDKKVSAEGAVKETVEETAEEPVKEVKKEKKESSKEKKKESTKEPKEPKDPGKESKKESLKESKEKKESSKEKKESSKESGKESSKDTSKESLKEPGKEKVSRKSSVKVKEKKKEPDAAAGEG
ncbi:protein PTHB1 isoform X3 [Salvelinus alpinus]|uniref:protein PTHB1 isoform X3 n=1 Tax=Salvelinus alpinus TaxID=8036 RepID=UPI0039FC21AC